MSNRNNLLWGPARWLIGHIAVNVDGLSLFPRIHMVERELIPKFPLESIIGHNGVLTPFFIPAEGGRDRQISEM